MEWPKIQVSVSSPATCDTREMGRNKYWFVCFFWTFTRWLCVQSVEIEQFKTPSDVYNVWLEQPQLCVAKVAEYAICVRDLDIVEVGLW